MLTKTIGAGLLAVAGFLGLLSFILEMRRHKRNGTFFLRSTDSIKLSRTNSERWCWGISSVLFAIGLLLIAI
jgi:hypothetical protein